MNGTNAPALQTTREFIKDIRTSVLLPEDDIAQALSAAISEMRLSSGLAMRRAIAESELVRATARRLVVDIATIENLIELVTGDSEFEAVGKGMLEGIDFTLAGGGMRELALAAHALACEDEEGEVADVTPQEILRRREQIRNWLQTA